jgi:hypothetical protein
MQPRKSTMGGGAPAMTLAPTTGNRDGVHEDKGNHWHTVAVFKLCRGLNAHVTQAGPPHSQVGTSGHTSHALHAVKRSLPPRPCPRSCRRDHAPALLRLAHNVEDGEKA